MATRTWLGIQQAIAQVGTVQITAYDASTTYKITIGNVTISTAGTGGTASATAAALQALLAASTQGMFAEITWSVSTDTITATANVAGTPFTLTPAVSGGTGTIGSYSATTANKSPNDLNDAVNWSGATLPTNSDTIVFDATSSVPVYWNLSSLSAVTISAVNIDMGYTGQIGLPELNSTGGYTEYRATELALDSAAGGATLNIGKGNGSGCGMVKLVLGSTGIWTITGYNTGSPIESGRAAVSIRGPSTATVATIQAGTVDFCALNTGVGGSSQSMTISVLNVGPSSGNQPTVRCGPGCTLTTVNNDNGTLEINSACTTLNHKGGQTTIIGAGAITTINDSAGTVYHFGTGTVTTLNVTGATFNVGDQGPAITVTNCKLGGAAQYLDRGNRVTETNGVALQALARLAGTQGGDVVVDKGPGRTFTVT